MNIATRENGLAIQGEDTGDSGSATMLYGTSGAAREVVCTEHTMRALAARGVVSPIRDSAGRRLYSKADIEAARAYLARARKRA